MSVPLTDTDSVATALLVSRRKRSAMTVMFRVNERELRRVIKRRGIERTTTPALKALAEFGLERLRAMPKEK